MKKNILASVLLSSIVLAVSAPTAFAVEQPNGDSVETSRVEVNLEKDDGHEPGTGPFKDKLAITHKPTVFKFKGNTTTGALVLSNVHPRSDNQFISVNDDRKDENDDTKLISSKWKLTGSLSELTADQKKLAANLVIKPGELKQYDVGDLVNNNGVVDFKPKDIDPASPAADATKFKLEKSFTLPADESEVTFLTSENDTVVKPTGVFTNLGDAELAIATGNAKTQGNYEGIITWTLSAQK